MKTIASRPRGEGSIATVTYLSEMFPGRAESKVRQAEDEWKRFGEENHVRIVIMRVAERVYGNPHRGFFSHSDMNPCRRKACTKEQPLTRIHTEDLAHIVTRMLSMFDMVETHGEDSFMHGSASLAASLKRFPSGLVLNLVDDAEPDTMSEANLWAEIISGGIPLEGLSNYMAQHPTSFKTPSASVDLKANSVMKQKLAYDLKYPSYRHGGAVLFGSQEYLRQQQLQRSTSVASTPGPGTQL